MIPTRASAPSTVEIAITGRCNLECRYCFYADEMTALSDLSTDEWRKIFRKLGSVKVLRIILSGGEPFTRQDIFKIIDSIVENRMRYSILTNGTLIDAKAVQAFDSGKRRMRLDSVQVSIDGSCAEVHDMNRPDSFAGSLAGLKLLVENGFPAVVRVTISKHNIDDLQSIAELLLDDIGIPSITFNEASPIGAGCICEKDVSLDHEDTLRAGIILEELSLRFRGRIGSSAGPLARLRMYREMESARNSRKLTDRWRMGYLSACGGVFDKLGILHDGSIVPCSLLFDLVLGNALDDDILDIWYNDEILRSLMLRNQVALSDILECRGCEWTQYCNGGCPGITQQIQRTFLEPSRRGCYRNFLKANGIESIDQL